MIQTQNAAGEIEIVPIIDPNPSPLYLCWGLTEPPPLPVIEL